MVPAPLPRHLAPWAWAQSSMTTRLNSSASSIILCSIDSINAAAYVADNLCSDLLRKVDMDRFFAWMKDFSTEPDWIALDIRHPQEAIPYVEKYGSENWLAIPYNEIRKRLR